MTASDREVRRMRIMNLVRGGLSYDAIARSEQLTRERVRQIIVRSLEDDRENLHLDTRLLNAARLQPALQLTARAIAEGRLEAVNPLIKVIDRLDRYAPPKPMPRYDGNARARLMAKLNLGYEKVLAARQSEKPSEGPASP